MTDMPKVEGLNVPGRDIRELRPLDKILPKKIFIKVD